MNTPPPIKLYISTRLLLAALLVGLFLGIVIGALAVGWWKETHLAVLSGKVAGLESQVRGLKDVSVVVQRSAEAALEACKGAMPASVAEQRQKMLDSIAQEHQKSTGVGGP